MITGYTSFVNYFKTIATSNTTIKDFVVGNSERILNRELSEIDYMVFWLEIPDIKPFYDGVLKFRHKSAFVVLANAPADDWDQEDMDLDLTLGVVKQFIRRLRADAEDGQFEFNEDALDIQWKGKYSGDNDWGWRVEFDIVTTIGDCDPDPNNWEDILIDPIGNNSIMRWNYPNQSGATVNINAAVPTDTTNVFVFREGALIEFNQGVTKSGNNLTFSPILQGELISVVYFNI